MHTHTLTDKDWTVKVTNSMFGLQLPFVCMQILSEVSFTKGHVWLCYDGFHICAVLKQFFVESMKPWSETKCWSGTHESSQGENETLESSPLSINANLI